jgi:quercetin dioxygenase-like cupin family protein
MLPVDSANDVIRLGTDEVVVLATGAQTGGDQFAVEVRMPPGGGPPVLHRHAPSEVYHMLRGEFTFYLGESGGPVRRVAAPAGAVVPLAGGTPHAVRNESDAEAAAFVVHAPGAVMEGFTRAAAALAADADMAAVLEVAAAHGVDLLGPVPA